MATATRDRTHSNRTASNRTGSIGGASTGALIGAAAAGVAVGLVANLGRKFAVQAPTALAGDWDDALKAEHKLTLAAFDKLQKTTEADKGKRSMLLTQIKHALAKHALQEENAIYPALREAGDKARADELNHDHGYVKQYLYELETTPNDSPEFMRKVIEFRALLEKHMAEEENDIFPRFKAKLSPEKNKALTTMMNKEGFKLA